MNIDVTRIFKENLRAEEDIIINQGGSRCFAPTQRVLTKKGVKEIQSLSEGEMVLTLNEYTQEKEWKPINEVFVMQNSKPSVRVNMADGTTIEATEDHEIYFQGGWFSLKHIVSLWYGRNLEEDT